MLKDANSLERLLTKIFKILCVGLFFTLLYFSVVMSGVNESVAKEGLFYVEDSLLANAFWTWIAISGFLLLFYVGRTLYRRLPIKVCGVLVSKCGMLSGHVMDLAAVTVSIIVGLTGFYWVTASNTAPYVDQFEICKYADAFNHGDYSALSKGGYVGVYQQQLGLITLMRIIFLLGGDFRVFQYFSADMAAHIVFFGYQITKLLSKDSKRAEGCFLMLAVCCVPLYGYVPFVYGEVVSAAFALLAAWMLLACLERFSWIKAVVFGLSAGLAVQLKANVQIMLIGFLIVILIKIISRRDRQTLILACSLAAGMFLCSGFIRHGVYGGKIPQDSEPMPSLLFVAMGCNWDGQNPGWYNGYNWNTYHKNNCDKEASVQDAKMQIHSFLEKCSKEPGYAADFYMNKMTAQWEAPMYQCLAMNNRFHGEQSRFAEQVYFGSLFQRLESFMNIYQILVYGGVFYLLLRKWRQWEEIEFYVLLIGIFGGFLFTLLWEAKARYVFNYFLYMLPYAAVGIGSLPVIKKIDSGGVSG